MFLLRTICLRCPRLASPSNLSLWRTVWVCSVQKSVWWAKEGCLKERWRGQKRLWNATRPKNGESQDERLARICGIDERLSLRLESCWERFTLARSASFREDCCSVCLEIGWVWGSSQGHSWDEAKNSGRLEKTRSWGEASAELRRDGPEKD